MVELTGVDCTIDLSLTPYKPVAHMSMLALLYLIRKNVKMISFTLDGLQQYLLSNEPGTSRLPSQPPNH